MSVGGMYCDALDAQRILSALQDMCTAYQESRWLLISDLMTHSLQMHWQHSNQNEERGETTTFELEIF